MSVPTKLPTMAPIAPLCAPTTSAIVAPIVISTFATLAIANPTGRSSTRKSAVICA